MNFANRDHNRNSALYIAKDILGNERSLHPLERPQFLQGANSQMPTWGNFLYTKHSSTNSLFKKILLSSSCFLTFSLIEGYWLSSFLVVFFIG